MATHYTVATGFDISSDRFAKMDVRNMISGESFSLFGVLDCESEDADNSPVELNSGDLRLLQIEAEMPRTQSDSDPEPRLYYCELCAFDESKLDWSEPPVAFCMDIEMERTFPSEEMETLFVNHFNRYRGTGEQFSVLLMYRDYGEDSGIDTWSRLTILDGTNELQARCEDEPPYSKLSPAEEDTLSESVSGIADLHSALEKLLGHLTIQTRGILHTIILE